MRFREFERRNRLFYGVAGCMFCISCSPHLIPNLVIRESKVDIPVPLALEIHVHNIAKAMNIAKPERIKVFINKGMSSVSAGNTLLPGGAVLGLSRLVLARTPRDVISSGITTNGQIMTASVGTQSVTNLLLPTANQINFTIGHEIAHIQNLDFLLRAMLAPVALVTLYHASCLLSPILSPSNPFAVVPMVFAIGLLFYAQIHFAICHWQEHRADRKSALNHHSYAEGGVDMMRKRLTLDNILKPIGSSRQRVIQGFKTHPPVEDRLKRLQGIWHKLQNNNL